MPNKFPPFEKFMFSMYSIFNEKLWKINKNELFNYFYV